MPRESAEEEETHSHVTLTADICLRQRAIELTRDAKVAELDETLLVDQHVGRLDVCEGRGEYQFCGRKR